MTIIEKIACSIHAALDERDEAGEVVRTFPFYYDTPETINKRLDYAAPPCAFFHVVESGTAIDVNGIIKERLTCEVVFSDITTLDFDGIENERIIDELKRKAFIWLQVLRKSGILRIDTIVSTSRYYATEDAILTGFAVTIRVEDMEGISPCDAPSVNF